MKKHISYSCFIICIFIISKISLALDPLFGPEFTFTNQKLINAIKDKNHVITEENLKALHLFKDKLEEHCSKIHNCTITEGQDKHGKIFKVKFPDGWHFTISLDVAVIEVQTLKTTVSGFVERKDLIKDLIFDLAKEIGLRPHRSIGSGHVNMDVKTSFEGDEELMRNFIAEEVNHPEFAYGIFGNHLGNSAPIAMLDLENYISFAVAIQKFDDEKRVRSFLLFSRRYNIYDLIKDIEDTVYTKNYYDWDFPRIYQHMNFSNWKEEADLENKRLELRGFKPQESIDEFILQIEFIRERLINLKNKGVRVELLPNLGFKARTIKSIKDNFIDYLSSNNMSQEKYSFFYRHLEDNDKPSFQEESFPYQISSPFSDEEISKSTFGLSANQRNLLPIPRQITQKDYNLLKDATVQRAKALRLFLDDVSKDSREFLETGIIPKNVYNRIISRYGHKPNFLNSRFFGYFYAPDIIRISDGSFRILEDGTGSIGGLVDSTFSRKDLLTAIPEYKKFLSADKGESILKKTINHIKENDDRAIVLLTYKEAYVDQAFRFNILDQEGVFIATSIDNDSYKIFVEDEKFYIRFKKGTREGEIKEVGTLLIYDINTKWVDENFSDAYDLERKGIINIIGGRGIEYFLGDKELFIYVDDIIRHYLNQEPLIKSLPTFSFLNGESGNDFNDELYQKVIKNPSNWVIKEPKGLQGKQVYILKLLPFEEVQKVLKRIELNPENYIAQERTLLSTYEGHYVDIRPITFSAPNKNIVIGDHMWSRAIETIGDGKANLSLNAKAVPIFVKELDLPVLPPLIKQENALMGAYIGKAIQKSKFAWREDMKIITRTQNIYQAKIFALFTAYRKSLGDQEFSLILSDEISNQEQVRTIELLLKDNYHIQPLIPYIAQKSFNQTIQTEAVLLLLQDERPILINIPHIAKETFHRPIQLEAIRVLIDNNRKVDVSIPYISTDSFKDDFQLEALKLVAESEYTVVEQMPFIASSKYSEFDFRALKILVNGGRDFRPSIELFLGKIETDTQLLALSLVTNEKDEDGDAVYRVVSNIDNILLVDNQQKLEIFEKMVKSHEDLQHLEEKLKKNCDEKMRVFQDISDLD